MPLFATDGLANMVRDSGVSSTDSPRSSAFMVELKFGVNDALADDLLKLAIESRLGPI